MNLKQAIQLLEELDSSCIVLKNNKIIYTSCDSGVKPLLLFLNKHVVGGGNDQLVLIDKVIGKAALLLAVKCGIQKIYTPIMSSLALDAAKHHPIQFSALQIVPYIINRSGNGMCPMESSVKDTLDIERAYQHIITTIHALTKMEYPTKNIN